ncbi:MAG TPA: Qat anti-phage system associated protein QatB [Thermoanaerobaculia bacterium]|nr:Qat anti-phage system associated protein QatB [Thermoanaerobaculia bacterium]
MRARHGASMAARSAIAGRSATARLGGFLAEGVRDGFAAVARRFGIEHLGRDVQFVLAAFVDLLAPDGAQLDEAAARKALIDTVNELFERYDVETNGIAALDSLTEDGMRDAMTLSIVHVIDEKFQQDLASRVEDGSMNERDANELMGQAREFIAGIVSIDLGAVDILSVDWDSTDGRDLVQQMYETAYSLLETPS